MEIVTMKIKTTIFIATFTAIVILITVLTGFCEGEKQWIGNKNIVYADPEKAIQCKIGEAFSISLDSNPTTGYKWQLAHSQDGKFLKLISSKYKAPKTELAGAGGKEIWSFKGLSVGQTKIVFEYKRPWEKDKEPIKRMTFMVNIQ
jgi:predicted secreted protein